MSKIRNREALRANITKSYLRCCCSCGKLFRTTSKASKAKCYDCSTNKFNCGEIM